MTFILIALFVCQTKSIFKPSTTKDEFWTTSF